MAENIRILSTKILLSNQKQFLLNANLSVIEADFIETQSLPIEDNVTVNEALIFTSQNAVNAVLEFDTLLELKSKKVFCVGIKSKALLEENGFIVQAHAGYAAELAEIIYLSYTNLSFTFFSGNLRRDVLPEMLKTNGISFNEIEVYETILTPQKINSKPDGMLFYSPSGVESYLKENKITDEMCFCIGTTTAKALENITNNIIIANQPSVENVIIQCINYYKAKS